MKRSLETITTDRKAVCRKTDRWRGRGTGREGEGKTDQIITRMVGKIKQTQIQRITQGKWACSLLPRKTSSLSSS